MDIKQINQYEAFHKIGQGIGSIIYKAWDSEYNRRVAIKMLYPNDSVYRDFEKISEYVGIEHPNLCTVYSVEKYEDSILVITDYIEGESLQNYILKSKFRKENLFQLLKELIAGLTELYKNNLVHGNIKPSNIIINNDKRPILTDAGLSPFEDFQKSPEFVIPYDAYHYLSPEQVLNESPTEKSDFFSLGTIAYRIMIGVLPFEGENEEQLSDAILRKQPDYDTLKTSPLKGVYSLFLGKLLAKSPDDRFTDTNELLATINEIELLDNNIEEYAPFRSKQNNPRKYLTVSILALLFIILWMVATLSNQ